MNATETSKLLRRLGACVNAREWARGHTLAWAWENCERPDWLEWLADELGVRMTAGARAEYGRVTAPARAEYARVRAAAWAEYARVTAAVWNEYDRARAAAWAEYVRVTAPAGAEYARVEAPAYRTAIPFSAILAAAKERT
jgi:cell division septum initiation protein DivIVA